MQPCPYWACVAFSGGLWLAACLQHAQHALLHHYLPLPPLLHVVSDLVQFSPMTQCCLM